MIIKSKKESQSKSIRTKLLVLPVSLIILSIIGILAVVWIKTNNNMMAEMEAQSDYLLNNVSARLTDYDSDDQQSYQQILEEFKGQQNIEYAGFIDNEYVYTANSDIDYIGKDMSQNESVISVINNSTFFTSDTELEDGTEIFEMIYPVQEEGQTIGALLVGFNVAGIGPVIMDTVINVMFIGVIVIILLSVLLYFISKDILTVVSAIEIDMNAMATGDFSEDLPEEILHREDEFGEIARAHATMKKAICDILESVLDRAEIVAAHSEELTATAHQSAISTSEMTSVIGEIAETSSNQAHDVENGATAVQELDRVMRINAGNMDTLNVSTDEVNTLKDEGVELVRDLVNKTEETRDAIREIGAVITDTNISADNIVKAIEMIKRISDQTNLLALNASIEAARAGEAGAGFAVVAEEIRNLAEDSSNFTGEIEVIVNDLTSKTLTAVDTMETVNEIIDLQGDSVNRTDAKFEGISAALEDIHAAISEVNSSNMDIDEQKEKIASLIENLAAIAEENAAGAEEASASVEEQNVVMGDISNASEELAETAEDLNSAVRVFTI